MTEPKSAAPDAEQDREGGAGQDCFKWQPALCSSEAQSVCYSLPEKAHLKTTGAD
jgi:hypothetical protein